MVPGSKSTNCTQKTFSEVATDHMPFVEGDVFADGTGNVVVSPPTRLLMRHKYTSILVEFSKIKEALLNVFIYGKSHIFKCFRQIKWKTCGHCTDLIYLCLVRFYEAG